MKKITIILISLFILINTQTSSLATSYVMHTVNKGDTLWNISKDFNIDIDKLKNLNDDVENKLSPNKLIKIKPISNISIKVNNKLLNPDKRPYLENDRTFVPIRFIAEALNVDEIIWKSNSKTAILKKDDKIIKLPIGSKTARVNNTYIKLDSYINIYEGRTFVPVRFVSEIFDCMVGWNQINYTVLIDTTNDYNKDLYWLSRIVHAEASAEPFEGKLAVANVILNRKKSPDFPNTIKGVIFDTKYGYQYTPAYNGTIYNNPSSESVQAAKLALEGKNNISTCLYFLNPRKADSNWIIENKTFYKRISLHDFYK
ncbi:MAG: LysM peptidoglycan-binding domain-containing protein [Firmicutes bacterium]|nr:LysM peptidoglycan-binding domain-containing protein [Bacillota bacterium]